MHTKQEQENTKYIAHAKAMPSAQGEFAIHSLPDHLRKVAKQAQKFAAQFGAGDWAYPAGLWHDLGKYRKAFQAHIQRGTGINPDAHIEKDNDLRTNHASSGAIYALDEFGKVGWPLAYMIAGHHAGLPDYEGGGEAKGAPLKVVVERDKSLLKEALCEQIPADILSCAKPATPCGGNEEGVHLWIRMLFSCLVDADFLDTESFMAPQKSEQRDAPIPLNKLLGVFNDNMAHMQRQSQPLLINKLRNELLSQCRNAATKTPGIFTLTIPTGGGKTLSSLAFALEHASKHQKRRVIYAIPYTSIIEQTATVFTNILAPLGHAVLEHHSNTEPDKESQENNKSRLATENWDAAIVVTTTVQLFESLFAARTSRCRKLHNIANSVIVLDEVQLLPPEHLAPIRKIIKLLAQYYGVTFVLATATPTSLDAQNSPFGKELLVGLDSTEIVLDPNKYYNALKRVRYILPADFQQNSWDEIAEKLKQHKSVLAVVNKRQDAKDLYDLMPEGTYHLSALMCPAHRSMVIKEIKKRLKNNQSTRVISTQLVEAGVDFDFPFVYRAMAGLDSIVQAAGRCNREGKLNDVGIVAVFVPPSSPPPGTISTAIASCRSIMGCLNEAESIDSPEVFARYFTHLFAKIETDKANMHNLLERDARRLQIQFRTAAYKFRMIDDSNTHTVYVRYGKEVDDWLVKLKFHPSKELLRKLQRYSVTVYDYQFNAMLAKGDIEEISAGYYAQSGGGIYDDQLGLLTGEIELTLSNSVL